MIYIFSIKYISQMYSSKKKNNKQKRPHLHASTKTFSPFDMVDSRYLEHLHQQAKIRNSRDTLLMKLKDYQESVQRANHRNERERLENEIDRPNILDSSKEHMKKRIEQLKKLEFT